jgi:hypothetical protein
MRVHVDKIVVCFLLAEKDATVVRKYGLLIFSFNLP